MRTVRKKEAVTRGGGRRLSKSDGRTKCNWTTPMYSRRRVVLGELEDEVEGILEILEKVDGPSPGVYTGGAEVLPDMTGKAALA